MVKLRHIDLEITSRCNMECLHCCQKSYLNQSNDITFQEVVSLIKEIRELSVETVGISGGEPFMRYDLFEILSSLEKSNIRISGILTNGLFLNHKTIKKITKLESKPWLFISLDGIDPIAMKLRGCYPKQCNQFFERIISNIKAVVEAEIPVMVNTVITKHNIDNLLPMYDFLKSIGIRGWRIALPNRTGAYLKNILRFEADREKVFNKYFKLTKYHLERIDFRKSFKLQIQYCFRIEVFKDFKMLSLRDFVCDYEGKRESCCIKPNGDVLPCSLEFNLFIGNIRQRTLKSIWNSKLMQQAKNTRIGDIEGCRSCRWIGFCGTGCRANAVFLNGCKLAPDDDACKSSEFFVKKISPLLWEKRILKTCL